MTSTITYHRGNVLDVVRSLPHGSVRSAIKSPPYWRKRSYIDPSRPEKAQEWGQEDSPGAFIANLLTLTDALWDVVADDGTIWVNLGDTAAGSGGAGGDYNEGGNRNGQNRFAGSHLSAALDAPPMSAPSVLERCRMALAEIGLPQHLVNVRDKRLRLSHALTAEQGWLMLCTIAYASPRHLMCLPCFNAMHAAELATSLPAERTEISKRYSAGCRVDRPFQRSSCGADL